MQPDPVVTEEAVEKIARAFHDEYQAFAEAHGWETQRTTRVAFDDLPERNRGTMLDTIRALLDRRLITLDSQEGREQGGWVTQREAARRLGVHENTVATMLSDGRLKAVEKGNGAGPVGTCRRVDLASLERLEADGTEEGSRRAGADLRRLCIGDVKVRGAFINSDNELLSLAVETPEESLELVPRQPTDSTPDALSVPDQFPGQPVGGERPELEERRKVLVSQLHSVADRIAATPVQIEDASLVRQAADALAVTQPHPQPDPGERPELEVLLDDDGPVLLEIREAVGEELSGGETFVYEDGAVPHTNDAAVEALGNEVSDRAMVALRSFLANRQPHPQLEQGEPDLVACLAAIHNNGYDSVRSLIDTKAREMLDAAITEAVAAVTVVRLADGGFSGSVNGVAATGKTELEVRDKLVGLLHREGEDEITVQRFRLTALQLLALAYAPAEPPSGVPHAPDQEAGTQGGGGPAGGDQGSSDKAVSNGD